MHLECLHHGDQVHWWVRRHYCLVGRGGFEPPALTPIFQMALSGPFSGTLSSEVGTRLNRSPQERCPHRQNDCVYNSIYHVILLVYAQNAV